MLTMLVVVVALEVGKTTGAVVLIRVLLRELVVELVVKGPVVGCCATLVVAVVAAVVVTACVVMAVVLATVVDAAGLVVWIDVVEMPTADVEDGPNGVDVDCGSNDPKMMEGA